MKKKIENLIYQYHWRRKEVYRIERILWGGYSRGPSARLVARYGIEATLPKPNTHLKSQAELKYLDAREERLYKRYKEYSEIVSAIERIPDYLENDIHRIIVDCMMDGMSYRSIADHLGINRNKIRDMKDDMLCQICQKCHFLHDLILEKNVV